MTFTAISFFLLKQRRGCPSRSKYPDYSLRCVIAKRNFLARVIRPVVAQSPGSHLLRPAVGHPDDDVAIPGPGMLAIILARTRRMIGVGMIPAQQVKPLFARSRFRGTHILCGQ